MDEKATERALNAVISKALAVLNRYDFDLDFDLIDAERHTSKRYVTTLSTSHADNSAFGLLCAPLSEKIAGAVIPREPEQLNGGHCRRGIRK